jgi:hypothetical protein
MSVDTSGGHEAMDYEEHERTYQGFLAGTKYMTLALACLLIGMAIFLV